MLSYKKSLRVFIFVLGVIFSFNAQAFWIDNDFPVSVNRETLSRQLKREFLSSTNKYDRIIREETQRYLPVVQWEFVKSQFFQESKFDVDAESHVGAKGIAQFTKGTWNQVSEELEYPSWYKPTDVRYAIRAGAYYDSKLFNYWESERPHLHRIAFMLASYNAGTGNILNAQKVCNQNTNENCNLWQPVIGELHHVTGHYSKETENYVENIFNFYILEKIN